MLKRAFTAVVERNVVVNGRLETEPYETPWASEARWFVYVLQAGPSAAVQISAEVSPDGLTWCPHEAAPAERRGPGLLSLPLTALGPWQRLVVTADQAPMPPKVIVYLCLKE
jgi:hypothetical protein